MIKYENYELINLPWLKEIPKNWNKKKLKKISHFKTGNSIKDEIKNKYSNKDNSYLFITTSDIDGEKLVINHQSSIFIPKSEKGFRISEVGSTLLCIEGGSGGKKVAFTSQLVCYGNKLCSIKLYLGVDKYLYYVLISDVFKTYYTMNINGDRNGISQKNVGEFVLPFPDITEQQQIVKYLDWKIEKIDKLIGIEKKKLEELENYKRSYLVSLIKNHEKNGKFKKISDFPEITEINEDYSIIPLFSIAIENKEKNKKKNNNLLSLSYGKIKRKNIATTKGLLPENFDSYQIVDYGMTVLRLTDLQNDKKSLRTGFVTEKGIITSAYTALIPDETKVRGEYLHLVLHNYDILKIFYRLGTGMRQSLSYNDLKKLPIILPTLEIQEQIIKKINDTTKRLDHIKEKINHKIKHYTSLKESLITEVITGQIDVRNEKIPERK